MINLDLTLRIYLAAFGKKIKKKKWGGPPLSTSKQDNLKKDPPMTPTFYDKILLFYKNKNVYKELDKKNMHFWPNDKHIFAVAW